MPAQIALDHDLDFVPPAVPMFADIRIHRRTGELERHAPARPRVGIASRGESFRSRPAECALLRPLATASAVEDQPGGDRPQSKGMAERSQ